MGLEIEVVAPVPAASAPGSGAERVLDGFAFGVDEEDSALSVVDVAVPEL